MARHVRASPKDSSGGGHDPRQRAEEALQILRFTKKRATRDVEKVLRSAIANAERKARMRRGRSMSIIFSFHAVL